MAVSRFLAHYVLTPTSHLGDDGYMADLPYLYARSTIGSALRLAVDSCALVSYATATRSSKTQLDAQTIYGMALSALRKATTDPDLAMKDETLIALLILDYYSVCV